MVKYGYREYLLSRCPISKGTRVVIKQKLGVTMISIERDFTKVENIKKLLLEYSDLESEQINDIDYDGLIEKLKDDTFFNDLLEEDVVNDESLCVYIYDKYLFGNI